MVEQSIPRLRCVLVIIRPAFQRGVACRTASQIKRRIVWSITGVTIVVVVGIAALPDMVCITFPIIRPWGNFTVSPDVAVGDVHFGRIGRCSIYGLQHTDGRGMVVGFRAAVGFYVEVVQVDGGTFPTAYAGIDVRVVAAAAGGEAVVAVVVPVRLDGDASTRHVDARPCGCL